MARVKEHIQARFEKLYTSKMCMSYTNSLVSNFSCCFFSKERNWIGREVVDEEIREGFWALKPFKVPRPNELYASFF